MAEVREPRLSTSTSERNISHVICFCSGRARANTLSAMRIAISTECPFFRGGVLFPSRCAMLLQKSHRARSMYGDRQPIPSFVCNNRNPAAGTDPCQGSTTRQYRVYLSSGPFQSGLAKVLPDLMAGGCRYTRVCLRHTGVSLPWSHLGELASSPDSAFCKVSSLRHSSKLGMQN